MDAILVTDNDWHLFFKEQPPTGEVINFWTPTLWKMSQLNNSSKLYFMLKSPIRKIGGYGFFNVYEEMTTEDAWKKYGVRNGVSSIEELISRNNKYAEKHSVVNHNGKIGCLQIRSALFLDNKDFVEPLTDLDVGFPKQIVKYKYCKISDEKHSRLFDRFFLSNDSNFSIVPVGNKISRLVPKSDRKGQSSFRDKVLNAYGNRCSITGSSELDVLEAAHIQPYINENSNHVQNGICLRADIHKLFDRHLLSININYEIVISSNLTDPEYLMLAQKPIRLPKNKKHWPSINALMKKMVSFRT